MATAVVSGADRNVGFEFAKQLLERGWNVFAGRYNTSITQLDDLKTQYPDRLTILMMDTSSDESIRAAAKAVAEATDTVDLMVHNAANFGRFGDYFGYTCDLDDFVIPYNTNAMGGIRMTQAFLPLMENGQKRLAYISSEAGAVSVSHRDNVSSYGMSKTALNMAVRLMFNKLQPMGFKFRLYHPGWVRGSNSDVSHGKFWPWETVQSALPQFLEDREWEDRLVLIDNEGMAWPF